jgi:glycerophosphoryl diester phosphodiesterase
MPLTRNLAALVLAASAALLPVPAASQKPVTSPTIIAHRGASGYLPEHTLAAYQLAIEQGADFIEPDLVSTNDGVLVARHEVAITDTTDVARRPEFAARRTTKVVDGITQSGWFADDFTLAEIKTLRAIQRLETRPRQFDGQFEIPTLEDVITLAKNLSQRTGRQIGVYPETKHPTFHAGRGLPLEPRLLEILTKADWNRRDAPVIVQSFEATSLRAIRKLSQVRLVQLVEDGNAARLTQAGLADIASYADGVGPNKRLVVDAQGKPAAGVVDRAHAAGLFVHVWTMRSEPQFLASLYKGNPIDEYLQFFCLGVDGLFSDFPDTAHTARALFRVSPQACAGVRAS